MKLNRISALSAYSRPQSHLTQQTAHGAIVTVCGVLLALTLLVHETSTFIDPKRVSRMSVDMERRHDTTINLDITFPVIPCAVISVEAMDASGTMESDISFANSMQLHKQRLDARGKHVGGAEYHTPVSQRLVDDGIEPTFNIDLEQMMRHIQDMNSEADAHEGCRIYGTITVRRVAGKLVIGVHQQTVFAFMPMLLGGGAMPQITNASHVIHRLSFGPHFPGQVNPLDGAMRMDSTPFSYKYFVKIVPTEFYGRFGGVTETHQYSVTEYAQMVSPESGQAASVEISFDVSPIIITINERPPSIMHFLVRLCAVVGGVFAVARMTDKLIHGMLKTLRM